MAYTLALSAARTKLIYVAAIDGKNGSNARHSTANLGSLLNWTYRELLSRAGQLGLPHGLTTTTGTLGSVASGEDYVSLAIPTTASEVIGVDVLGSSTGSEWTALDPITWGQRRDVRSMVPSHGVGFWAQRLAPTVSGSTLTAGALALWAYGLTSLAGLSYTLSQVIQWVEITSDTDVFLLHEGWESWLLNKAAMGCTARDANKRGNWEVVRDAWHAADALLMAQAARHNRAGAVEPAPYRGVIL